MKIFVAAVFALAAAPFASAAAAPADGGVIAVRAIDAVAFLIKIDRTTRTVTIKDPKGVPVTIDVPSQVPLDQLQEGALLDVRYLEAEALTIVKAGVLPTFVVQSVAIAPQIGGPAGLSAKPRRVAGRIRAIDRLKRALTIVGPDDKLIALNVAPVVEGFDELKAGDTAVIEYTAAVVLSAVQHDGGKPGSPRL